MFFKVKYLDISLAVPLHQNLQGPYGKTNVLVQYSGTRLCPGPCNQRLARVFWLVTVVQ